jgi:hypothetical protein
MTCREGMKVHAIFSLHYWDVRTTQYHPATHWQATAAGDWVEDVIQQGAQTWDSEMGTLGGK